MARRVVFGTLVILSVLTITVLLFQHLMLA